MASFALFFRSFALLEPLSYWWHLAVGDVIHTWQRIPDKQLFLFTVDAEQPWFYTSWFGEFLLALLHGIGGGGLVLLVHNLVVALSLSIIAYALARQVASLTAIFFAGLVSALALSVYIGVAPWSFAMPFMALATVCSIAILRRPRAFLALLLPLITALLTNLDLTSAVLIALLAISISIALFQKKRPLPASILLTSPLALLTFAYGPAALFSALAHLELAPATAPVIFFLTFILANRLETLPQFSQIKIPAGLFTTATILVLIGGIALQPGVPTRDPILTKLRPDARQRPPLQAVMRQELPLRCAEALRDSGKELRLFAEQKYAGFLLFHIQDPAKPAPLLFEDHRRLLSEQQVELRSLIATEPIARGVFQQEGINAAVVSADTYPALVTDLNQAHNWQDLQEDPDTKIRCFLKIL